MNRQERRIAKSHRQMTKEQTSQLMQAGGNEDTFLPLETVKELLRKAGSDNPEEHLRQVLASGRLVAHHLPPDKDGQCEIIIRTVDLMSWLSPKS